MMFHLSLECFYIDIEEIPLQHTYKAVVHVFSLFENDELHTVCNQQYC